MALTARKTDTDDGIEQNAATMMEPQGDWRCTCKGQMGQGTTTWSFYGVFLKSKTTNTHRRNCPKFCEKRNTSTKSLAFVHASRILGRIVHLSFNVQIGAGGMSVGPSLTLKGIYRPNSPIHAVIEELPTAFFKLEGRTIEEFTDRLRDASLHIRKMLQKGECSLYDVDERGRTTMKVMNAFQKLPIYAEHI